MPDSPTIKTLHSTHLPKDSKDIDITKFTSLQSFIMSFHMGERTTDRCHFCIEKITVETPWVDLSFLPLPLEFVFCKGDVHLQCLKTWSKEIQEHLKYRHKCVECMWLKKDDSSPEELQKDILEILHDRQRKLDESKNQIEANQQKIDAPSDIKNTGINLTPRSLPTRVFVSIIWNPEIERFEPIEFVKIIDEKEDDSFITNCHICHEHITVYDPNWKDLSKSPLEAYCNGKVHSSCLENSAKIGCKSKYPFCAICMTIPGFNPEKQKMIQEQHLEEIKKFKNTKEFPHLNHASEENALVGVEFEPEDSIPNYYHHQTTHSGDAKLPQNELYDSIYLVTDVEMIETNESINQNELESTNMDHDAIALETMDLEEF